MSATEIRSVSVLGTYFPSSCLLSSILLRYKTGGGWGGNFRRDKTVLAEVKDPILKGGPAAVWCRQLHSVTPATHCRLWGFGSHTSLRSLSTWWGFIKRLYSPWTRGCFLRSPFNFNIAYCSCKKYPILVTEHVCEHSVFAMFVYCCTLIYVPSFAHRLKMCSYTPQSGSKTIEEIIKEMKHSCSVHSVCAAAQWQLKCHLKYRFKFCTGTTKAALIPSNLNCSIQEAQTSSAASKYEVFCLQCWD